MTGRDLFEPRGDHDVRMALGSSGLLRLANRAGLLEAADVHVATRVGALAGEADDAVLFAVALAVRAVRTGSVGADLTTLPALAPDLPWPDAATWVDDVASSPLVAQGAIRIEHGLLYLDRYHRLEAEVCADLLTRLAAPLPDVDPERLATALSRVRGPGFSDEQESACVRAVEEWTTVLTGGPGTGKTTTIARLLVLLADQHPERPLSIALTAPTGKAATRLAEAVLDHLSEVGDTAGIRPEAMTLHRLLGWRPDNATRFRHDRGNRLGYDVVVVDECSMVELTMMARLLEAVRPQARLVLVGDPDQLTSVGAGAVLADVVRGLDGGRRTPVVALSRNFRSTHRIQGLAEAVREGDADAVLASLRGGDVDGEVEFVETEDPAALLRADLTAVAAGIREAAADGDVGAALAALEEHRLLCAHRDGPVGVRHWNALVERWLAERLGLHALERWYLGRPVLVTANDHALGLYNGEIGVTMLDDSGRSRVWVAGSARPREFAPGRLDAVDTMHAATVHKSQGTQAARVTVLLPEPGSRLLTRELLYTAVTRAEERVRVVGTEAAVRMAVARPAQRASGLAARLRDGRHGD